MSVESCRTFFERTQREAELGLRVRALTDPYELIALGRRYGYTFDLQDVAVASSLPDDDELGPRPIAVPASQGALDGEAITTVGHYELDLRGLSGMESILAELPQLTIKPATVDLDDYRASFRREDLEWTEMSPADPAFGSRLAEVMEADSGREDGRRGFHLVNLDQHLEHPEYESYFAAKTRLLASLEQLFGPDVRFSGSMWYPPYAYRLWHTNETQPGWRMYLLDFDEEVGPSDMRTFFRYMNPQTKDIVTLQDRPKMLRFFKVEQAKDRLLWHCIVNGANRNRWAFGFVVPDDWQSRLPAEAAQALTGLSTEAVDAR